MICYLFSAYKVKNSKLFILLPVGKYRVIVNFFCINDKHLL